MNTPTELRLHTRIAGNHPDAGWEAPRRTWSSHAPLLVILALGLLVRLALLYMTMDTRLMIVDEQHYHTLALNLAHGHGFARQPGALTSIRPPLYPFFIALIWLITGTESLLAVRIAQILLSLANVFVLYRLGLCLFNRRIALLAAAGFCFYPSFVGFNFLLLTEVLFTLLLTLVVLCYVSLAKTGKSSVAWGLGAVLGLAALTRSVLWPFPVVLAPLVLFYTPGNLQKRLKIVLFLCLGYALVITKRFAEYRRIGDGAVAAKYRKSFAYYTEERLLVSMLFYQTMCAFFAGIFLVRYRMELILFVPIAAGFFAYYLKLGLQEDSPVQNPEKLHKENGFLLYVALSVLVFVLLMFVRVPVLYDVFEVTPSRIAPLWTLDGGAK